MASCVSSFSVSLVAKPRHAYPAGQRTRSGQKTQVVRRPFDAARSGVTHASPSAELQRTTTGAPLTDRTVEAFIVETESNIVPAPEQKRALPRQLSKKDAEVENLVARMEGALEAALAALEDEKRSAASKAEAVASAFRMTKGVAVDLFKENQRLQSEVRKARTAEAQASKAVEQGVDELLRLQAEIRSAQHAEKKDIVESLERHRRDNARLQAEVQGLKRDTNRLRARLEDTEKKLAACELPQE